MKQLAINTGGVFSPELECDTIGQCIAAVQAGSYAAVLPVQAWRAPAENEVVVVEDNALDALTRRIALAWHPRTLEAMSQLAQKAKEILVKALKEQGASALPDAGEDEN